MSTHKNIERICVVITIIAILVTVLFMNGSKFGIVADDSVTLGYEEKIFDDSYVHTIDIEIDDWDSFIETATDEEYTAVDVTIDGETKSNVGLRAKGNTSLSTVAQLGSERYSLKIEFDAYESNNLYYGLDKLCLNNLIQDYTMMKDYITYKLMYEFGVASPLVSYAFVTINGEDWGLFLAVEAVEDAFLERNFGTNYGDLYKPDSMSMGGGRGNGGGFDMKEVDFDELGMENPFERSETSEDGTTDGGGNAQEFSGPPDGDFAPQDMGGEAPAVGDRSGNGSEGGEQAGTEDRSGNGEQPQAGENTENRGSTESGEQAGTESGENQGSGGHGGHGGHGGGPGGDGGQGGGPGGGGGMGSDDTKIKYIDDDPDSYSNIFDSAKTKVSKSDEKRLIQSIKTLNEGLAAGDKDAIAEAVDVDALMRYMVVHNYVVNGDSYTGSMIHNFYLYEEDGLMTFFPWDYNLAFGTFQAGDSDSTVNDPIDNPLSITDGDTDRPMFSWIISCDEYTELYHEYFSEFLEQFYTSGYIADLIDTTSEMIAEYVERDPTKFCEVSDFEKGVETIKEFVELRCQSVSGQVEGTIGSTDAEQTEDPDALIDASSMTLSDMGSMGGMGGHGGDNGSGGMGGPGGDNSSGENGGPGGMGGDMGGPDGSGGSGGGMGGPDEGGGQKNTERSDNTESTENTGNADDQGGNSGADETSATNETGATDVAAETVAAGTNETESTEMTGGFGGPDGNSGMGGGPGGDSASGENSGPGGMGGAPGMGGSGETAGNSEIDVMNYVYLGVCVAALIAAIAVALIYRKRSW